MEKESNSTEASASLDKQKHKYLKPLLAILIGIILIGATGFGVWYVMNEQAKNDKDESDKQIQELQKQVNELKSAQEPKKEEKKSNKGFIEGSLTYPSEQIPADLVVYAENVDTGEVYETSDRITDDRFTISRTGYKIEVPEGSYYIYAKMASAPDKKAYYNRFITCGMSVECADTTKLVVEVIAGETVENITVGDWWNI